MIRTRMKALLVALLVIQLVIPSTILAAAVGQFTSVVGNVKQTSAGVVIKPEVKSPIQMKDLIVTGDRSTASMLFDDESTIGLAPNSNFEIKEFYVKEKTRTGLFALTLGKLTADVKKFIGGDSTFVVGTPTAVAGVRGTGFEIVVGMVGGQMTTTITCTAGSLSISALSATGAVVSTSTIVAGQTAVVSGGAINISATAAGAAGASAGTAATAGVTVGTIAVGVAVAAAAAAAVLTSTGSETKTTTTHTTTTHH